MYFEKYEELIESVNKIFDNDQYDESIDILMNAYKYLPMNEYQVNIYDILRTALYIATVGHKYDTAIMLIKRMQELNLIVSRYSLNNINKEINVSELIEKNNEVIKNIEMNSKLIYKVFLPDDYDKDRKYPLFINFHGDGNTIETHRQDWKEELTTKRGYITVYVQSPHVFLQGSYKWCLYDEASPFIMFKDFYLNITNLYDEVCRDYNIDKSNIVLGGFSSGACAAVDLSMTDIMPVKGVIALCPYITDKFTDDNIKKAITNGTKWSLIEGEIMPDEAKLIDDRISTNSKDSKNSMYVLCKNLEHLFPDNFEELIDKSFNFILG